MTVGITGPVQFVVIGLENDKQMGQITYELYRTSERGAIQVLDMLAVQKMPDGTVISLHGGDLARDQAPGYGALIAGLMDYRVTASPDGVGIGSDFAVKTYMKRKNNIWDLTELIPPKMTALLVLLENRWAIPLEDAYAQMKFGGIGVIVVREAIETAGGVVLGQVMMQRETKIELGADVALDLAATGHNEISGSFDMPTW